MKRLVLDHHGVLAPDNQRHEAQARHQPCPTACKCRICVHAAQWDQPTVLFLAFLTAFLMRVFFSPGVKASHVLRNRLVVSFRFRFSLGSSEEDCSLTIVLYPFLAFFMENAIALGLFNFL